MVPVASEITVILLIVLAVLMGCLGALAVVWVWSPYVESWVARAMITPLGIIVALVGLLAFGGFVRGRWY